MTEKWSATNFFLLKDIQTKFIAISIITEGLKANNTNNIILKLDALVCFNVKLHLHKNLKSSIEGMIIKNLLI